MVKAFFNPLSFFMDLVEQIRLHKELSKKIEALEEQKKALGIAIQQQMHTKILRIPGYLVRSMSRLSIKLTIDQARPWNAVKLEETVDKEKIKELYKTGQQIPGVSEISYIQITEQEN